MTHHCRYCGVPRHNAQSRRLHEHHCEGRSEEDRAHYREFRMWPPRREERAHRSKARSET